MEDQAQKAFIELSNAVALLAQANINLTITVRQLSQRLTGVESDAVRLNRRAQQIAETAQNIGGPGA